MLTPNVNNVDNTKKQACTGVLHIDQRHKMQVIVVLIMIIVGAMALVGLGGLLVGTRRAANREAALKQQHADTAPMPMDFGGAPPRRRARHGQPAVASWHHSAPRTTQ
jgi:hypothetical protein